MVVKVPPPAQILKQCHQFGAAFFHYTGEDVHFRLISISALPRLIESTVTLKIQWGCRKLSRTPPFRFCDLANKS